MKKIVLFAVFIWAQQASCDAVSESLQAKLNANHTMSAQFTQTVKANKRDVSSSSGTMALSRPGRFRWQTTQPMPQLLIADGKRLWIYDADLEQVTVKKQDSGLGSTAGLFLNGYTDTVARDFDVTQTIEGRRTYFDLHAKSSKANFQRVKLMFVGNELNGMELFDQLGQHTQVHLSHIKINPILAPALFQFKVPKGVDVVEQ